MEIQFTTRIFKEGRAYVAHALELDVSSCGGSKEKALSTPFHKYTNVLFWLEYGAGLWHGGIRCPLMPRTSPYAIRLSSTELAQLENRAGKYTLPYFQVQRAKMILLSAEGWSNEQIATRLDTRREVVCFWRKRFFNERLAGLEERS